MYSAEVRRKAFKERARAVHDWVFTTVPGMGLMAALAITSALMFKSTVYTVLVVGTFMFLLGSIVGHRKEDK